MQRSSRRWLLIFIVSGCLVVWAWNSPFFWWFYDARSLYSPVFVRPFDPYTKGETVEGELYERFDTEHAIMLTFDRGRSFNDDLRVMNGRFYLEITSDTHDLQRWDIQVERSMITRISRWYGAEKWLQRFELPYPGVSGPVHFKLTVVEPIAFPKGIQPPACCLVRAVYHL